MNDATIRMPKESLEKWLAALRSGEYRQAQGALERDGGYCCLGVLQMCLDSKVELTSNAKLPAGLPSREWLQSNSITFLDYPGSSQGDWTSCEPYLTSLGVMASLANDGGVDEACSDKENLEVKSCTFAQIADAIEACAVGE